MSDLNNFNVEPTMMAGRMDYRDYLRRTFTQMAAGLGITAVVAWLCYTSLINGGLVYHVLEGFPFITVIMLVAQLAVVIVMSSRIMKLQPGTVTMLFYGYAVLTGMTFSLLPLAYGVSNVFIAFAYAAGLFGCMAIIGYTTKADLSRLSTVLYAGLFMLVIAGIVRIFVDMTAIETIICFVGIFIFMGLTAYDMQKMKALYGQCTDPAMAAKLSTYSALQLYLDFINLFLYIVRLLGGSRDRK